MTIRRVGWMKYEVGSTSLSEPILMNTGQVDALRKALETVCRVLPEVAVEDWHRRRRPLLSWPRAERRAAQAG